MIRSITVEMRRKCFSLFVASVGLSMGAIFVGCGIEGVGDWQDSAAADDFEQFEVAMKLFHDDIGRFPTVQEGLVALLDGAVLPKSERRRWDGPYCRFVRRGDEGEILDWRRLPIVYRDQGEFVEIVSVGGDGLLNSNDDVIRSITKLGDR